MCNAQASPMRMTLAHPYHALHSPIDAPQRYYFSKGRQIWIMLVLDIFITKLVAVRAKIDE